MVLQANGTDTANSTILAIQLEAVMMAPELSATDASYPCRWKNRTRVAKTAAVPPASPLNALATSTPATRANGSGPATLPTASTAEDA
jgi:hypothetical protein